MLLLSALMLIGCNKSESNFITLSDKVCSFPYEGGSVTVTVDAENSWEYRTSADWLNVDRNNNNLVISVDINSNREERSAEIAIVAGSAASTISVFQVGNPNMEVIFRKGPSVFSQECYYAATVYSITNEDATEDVYVGLMDIRNDEMISFGPFPYDAYPLSKVRAVADNGDCYISDYTEQGVYFFDFARGILLKFEDNALIFSCSSDGSVAVGAKINENMNDDGDTPAYLPYKWVDGVAVRLPMPDTPFRESNSWYGGLIPRKVSADGKIIYGTEWQNMDDYMIWWDENDNWHYVAEDARKIDYVEAVDSDGNVGILVLASGMINQNATYAMTNSGKWLTGWFAENVIHDDGSISWDFYPGFYNRETNKTYIFREYLDGRGIAVRDDGIGFIRTNSAPYQTDSTLCDFYAVDIESGTVISTIQNWFYDNYGIYTPAKEWLMGFSSDNKVAFFATSYVLDRR